MSYQEIHIPDPFKYVSEVPEFKEDVPDNCYIDKTSCGCGFTTAVLMNGVDYVVAIPFKALGDNKILQSKDNPMYPHELFVFHSGIAQSRNKLSDYLERNKDKVKKILVTYDSVPTLKEFINFSDYKLFIDEGHKLIEFAGTFKPKVVNNLFKAMKEFRAFVVATATPTREEYLPVELKDYPKLKLIWDVSTEVVINHLNIHAKDLRESILGVCLEFYRNKEENVYVYYNSVKSIVNVCKDLQKYGVKSEDVKIICADNERNEELLKPLGKGWNIKPVIEEEAPDRYYKINFITSTAFEGQDFMDPQGVTYVVSDGRLDHTKLDITTQVSQILGRLRVSRFKHILNMIWTVAPTKGCSTEEEYYKLVQVEKKKGESYFNSYNMVSDDRAKKALINEVKSDVFFIDNSEGKEYDLIMNPNAENNLMNSFVGTTLQYFVNPVGDLEDVENKVTTTLNEIFSGATVSNMVIPKLSPSDKRKIRKRVNFGDAVKQYLQVKRELARGDFLNEEEKTLLESIVEDFESDAEYDVVFEYDKVVESMFNLEDIATVRADRLRKDIKDTQELNLVKDLLKAHIEVGTVITTDEIKEKIEEFKIKYGLSIKVPASVVARIFHASPTSTVIEGKKYNAFKVEMVNYSA